MDNPSRILILQLKRAGDVIVTTPVIGALKRRFPAAAIDFLVDKPFATILENHPALESVHVFDRGNILATWERIRARRYDWIFDFQSSPRSALVCRRSDAAVTAGFRVPFWGKIYSHTVPRPGGGLSATEGKFSLVESITGALGPRPARQVFLTDLEMARAADLMGRSDHGPIIGLIPTHRRVSRRWVAESFAEVGRRWLAQGASVWLFWGPGEKEEVETLSKTMPGSRIIPSTTLREMAALLARCRLVITNDNGPMHLATAVGAPTVTLYGPTDPVNWNPGGPEHVALQAQGLRCLGCNLNECPFGHECMTGITPDIVWERSRSLLGASVGSGVH